jgi:hypothetical protein
VGPMDKGDNRRPGSTCHQDETPFYASFMAGVCGSTKL